MQSDNPYAAPLSPVAPVPAPEPSFFTTWPGLAVMYNGILMAETISVCAFSRLNPLRDSSLMISLLICAVWANLCFLCGPFFEFVAAVVTGKRSTKARLVIFWLGTPFAAMLTLYVLFLILISRAGFGMN